MIQLYCDEPDCDRPVAGHGKGKCSTHLKQLQRTGKTSPIAQKLTPEGRAHEAGIAMMDAADGPDPIYEAKRRAWLIACKALGMKERIEAIRLGLAAARKAGKRIGRAPKAERENVLATFSEASEVVGAAKAAEITARLHRISRRTVFRYLAVTKGSLLSPSLSAPRPRRAG